MARNKKRSSFRGKVKHNAQSRKAGYGYLNLPKGVSVFTPKAKTTVELDFMPYEVTDKRHPDRNTEKEIAIPESLWWKRPFKIHRNIGVDNNRVVCLTSIGKACPICEKRAELIRNDADKEDTDALKQSARSLYCIIPLNSKDHEVEPHIMDMADYLCLDEIDNTVDEDEDYEVFPSLEEGWTLKCRIDAGQIGSGKPFPEFGKITMIKRKEQYTEDILDDIPNLDEVLQILSYKDLDAKFLQLDEEDTTDEDAPEESTSKFERRRKPKSTDNDDIPTEEETKKTEREKKREERKKRAEEKNEGGECPYGHKFGEDCDEYPKDCDKCEKWDDCGEAQDDKK